MTDPTPMVVNNNNHTHTSSTPPGGGGGGGGGDTAAAAPTVLLDEAGKSGRHIALHPLAIVTICDHCTRVKVGGSLLPASSRVLGIIFGVQDGLQVSITDAFELQYDIDPVTGAIKIPQAYVNEKLELFSAVNQGAEVMGWYAVGKDIAAGDLEIHRAMTEWNESPIFLLLSEEAALEGAMAGSKDLPVRLFESELHVVQEVPTMLFVPVPFQLAAAEAERISVEHVVKAAPTEGESSVDLHVEGVKTALHALIMRVQTVLGVLEEIKEGRVKADYRLLRQVGTLCNMLPVAGRGGGGGKNGGGGGNEEFEEAFLGEYNDSLIVAYLASVSKLTSLSNEVMEKVTMAFGEGGGGGGVGGSRGVGRRR